MNHPKLWLIPLFLCIAFLEFWLMNRQGDKRHTMANTVMNLSIGAIDQLFSLSGFFLLFMALDFVYQNFSLFHFENAWPQWMLAYLGVDFISYWYHRYSHKINILWAGHVTHHSSSLFNFTNGFRTSPFQGLNRIPFWLILPVFGFSPFVLVFTLKISGLFDFLQHTQAVPKLGWVEKVFITPSLHRVHHGKNPLYIDKNFGSTFSFWDRMFGTYQEEKEPVEFGIKNSDYQDNNPFNAIFFQYKNIWQSVLLNRDWLSKMQMIFGSPDWKPKNLGQIIARKKTERIETQNGHLVYASFQLLTCPTAIILLLAFKDSIPVLPFLLFAFTGLAGMVSATLIFNKNVGCNFKSIELFRLIASLAFGLGLFGLIGFSFGWYFIFYLIISMGIVLRFKMEDSSIRHLSEVHARQLIKRI